MEPVTTPLPRLLTVKAVAQHVCLSKGRVYELIRLGILPAVHFGERQVRVSEDALRAFIDAGGTRPTAEAPREAV